MTYRYEIAAQLQAEGLTYREIATRMGVSVPRVSAMLRRAREVARMTEAGTHKPRE